MTLSERINSDMTAAMKSREVLKLSTLRMVKTAFKLQEVENMAPLDDEQAARVLLRMCKQRRDSIEQFEKGNRPELAEKERQEMAIIEAYLPQQVDEVSIRAAVKQAITDLGATSSKQMGQVMSHIKEQFKGQTLDGKMVSQIVKESLSSGG